MRNSDFENWVLSSKPSLISTARSMMGVVPQMHQTPSIIEEHEMRATQMDVFSRLMADRIIYFASEVTDETCSVVNAQLLYLTSVDPDSKITIYIDSPGGSCSSGLGLIETIGFIQPKVETINMGLAASMGSLLLMAGSKGMRRSLPGSRVLIHQPSVSGVKGTADQIKIEADEIMKCKKELFSFISARTGQPYEKIVADAKDDFWLTAQEALDYGCIDEIIKIDWTKK